jgi:putative membrane protein insertion efficiency factor
MIRLAGLLLLTVCLCGHQAAAEDWGPWEVPQQQTNRKSLPVKMGPLQLAVRLFQKYISPIDGPRCPMYPTCSSYSLQALHKHGPITGTFLTVDRLYREGDPHERHRPVEKWGRIRFYDPLEDNDFWWEK